MAELLDRLRSAIGDRYRLERELGQGGMATVYLAHDMRHDREVAIKVLRPELAATLGPDRFLQEIQIAARLTHPHILPLHDSGEAGGFLYYVMPYIDGESLRDRLSRESELPVPEAVRVLKEVTDALAYAHGRGVVHRDIKPENVMLSGRHALVTDFGVAKALYEATGRQRLTTAGIALGTPAYMSPEQAAADPHVDHRADIYAVGAMGYELLTGRTPFTGSSAQMVLTAHLTEAPRPVTEHRAAVPPALAGTIMRCLEKKPADRWQTAGELLTQLELLATPSGGTTPVHTQPVPAVVRRSRLLPIALGLLGVIAAMAVVLVQSRDSGLPALGRQTRITDAPGLETQPVISPDGRLIAYTAGPYFQSHVYVRQVSGGPTIDLTAELPGRHSSPRWAPGGNELLFVTNDGRIRRVSRVSSLGPPARPMVELESDDVIASAEWAPDGTRLAYDLGATIFVVSAPGAVAKPLYTGTDPYAISWSPDGRFVAFVESNNRLWHGVTGLVNTAPSMVMVTPSEGGRVDTIARRTAMNLSPTWGPDSRTLYFISSRDGAKDVYRIRLSSSGGPSGPAQRLSTGLNAHTIALSRDGKTLAFSTLSREANIWMLPLRPGITITEDAAVPVTTGAQAIERVEVSPDGRWLVYDSDRQGNADIHRLRLDQPGAQPEQLTSDSADDYSATVSPDGKELLFHSLRTGNRDLWVMGIDGTNPRQVSHSTIEEYAGSWSPDGRSVAYYADSAGTIWLGAVSRTAQGDWGPPHLLLPKTFNPAWSPDGNRLAALHDGSLAVITLPERTIRAILPAPQAFQQGTRQVVWAPDGRIYFRVREPDGRLDLVSLSPNGGPPVVLVRPRDASRAGTRTDWFTDGRRLYFTIARYEGDVSTIEMR